MGIETERPARPLLDQRVAPGLGAGWGLKLDLTDDGRIAVRTSWDDLPWFLTPAAADELADTLKSFAAVSRARHGQAGEGTGEG